MGILDSLAARFSFLKSPPEDIYDVAIVLRLANGNYAPTLNCFMDASDFFDMQRDWLEAIPLKEIQRAGCYWMRINGDDVRHGLILNNIETLTGVLLKNNKDSEA